MNVSNRIPTSAQPSMVPETEPLVRVASLSIGIDRGDGRLVVPVLNNVSLEIASGEVVGVIGASGSGKSTLALALAGYLRPGACVIAGDILYRGKRILGATRPELEVIRGRNIAYVPQSAASAFNPALRIHGQVVEGPVLRGDLKKVEAQATAIQLYQELRLPEPHSIGQRLPYQVSGGQLQRAAAAMAFINQPELVIFDEPTTALDVTTQAGVLLAFKDWIRSRGSSAFYISHDLAVVAQLADRIIVMDKGQIVDQGSVSAIVSRHFISTAEEPRPRTRYSDDGERSLLELRNISVRYPSSRAAALKSVSLSVAPREIVAVVGESGSGKSTLARVVCGLEKVASGDLRFAGEMLENLVHRRLPEMRNAIQIVFQSAELSLNPAHQVKKLLGRPMSLAGGLAGRERADEIRSLLEQVGLPPEVADRRPAQLSGGQKQRVNLARALAAKPRLIVCDEVTSALDVPMRTVIAKLLRKLQEEYGLALLFITHDLSIAATLADRIVVLHQGSIVEQGPTREILDHPSHPYTQALMRSVPELDPAWIETVRATRATK